ncbi:3-hydroxyisobutyrate dehydrogenase-like beta-hydroxyacid dehydrogenase [Halarchaeum rubridurum]|uniref:2-hydroxy-3-oxopropionate reductase n=1 Tax=Halarchaeum rubridurum TaxID=489911 RepID=A0A830FPP5_9EURY|nr:NAD(P)-dependent oxidoreductase [Halarchaeum rubridurum]MBP1954243.1 3-hydroxyisobutyrate dehydrogenase-like beta-hydroxyacid dehydrogenase [Halarchaeum rubridurum]GGM58459.1 2-hydroxy-3-oxopropionate reductase [Halarchaeum rubridurum]
MTTVGFVGLGAMGAPMAWNVADDFDLVVYNRSEDATEPFADAGVPVATTPRGVAADADVTVVMVTDGDALHDVLTETDGLLAGLDEGDYVVNTSTVSPDATGAAASLVADAGGRFVDCPVSGTVGPAEQGTLTMLAGGADEDVDAVVDVLDAIGDSVVRCGGVGDGTHAKLSVNLLLGDMMQSFAESLALADANGLDVDVLLEAVGSGGLAAPLFDVKGEAIAEGDFEAAFPMDLQFKDLRLALDSAHENEVPLPATAATAEAANQVRALGHGDEDIAAFVCGIEDVTGDDIRR